MNCLFCNKKLQIKKLNFNPPESNFNSYFNSYSNGSKFLLQSTNCLYCYATFYLLADILIGFIIDISGNYLELKFLGQPQLFLNKTKINYNLLFYKDKIKKLQLFI
jgi:hypothetical protein